MLALYFKQAKYFLAWTFTYCVFRVHPSSDASQKLGTTQYHSTLCPIYSRWVFVLADASDSCQCQYGNQ